MSLKMRFNFLVVMISAALANYAIAEANTTAAASQAPQAAAKTAAPESPAKPAEKPATTATATTPTAATTTPARDVAGSAAPAEAAPSDGKQIRKILAAQPDDPSMILEPIPEEPKKPEPRKIKEPPKPPPTRNNASVGGPNSFSNGLQAIGGAAPTMPGSMGGAPGTAGIPGTPGAMLNSKLNRFGRTPTEAPSAPELAVILVGRVFYPGRVRLKEGVQTRLYFTTTNDRPAAIVIEQLQVQRWVAKEGGPKQPPEGENTKFEATREITNNKVSEVVLEPRRGTYSFHDAISGARGQIIVE